MELKENAHGVWVLDADGNIIGGSSANPQMSRIDRESDNVEVTITNALSNAFYLGDKGGFGAQLPAGMTACAIGVHVSKEENGAYVPLYDDESAGTPIQVGDGTTDLSSKAFTFPAKVYPWTWVKLWSQNGSGTNVNQASPRLVTVVRKS